ncbi:MAG: hypothetical protein M3492_05305 [Actinomycetota bacterium]|nr:hypothetical protein [Actinomycetota bacterium]
MALLAVALVGATLLALDVALPRTWALAIAGGIVLPADGLVRRTGPSGASAR